jgi:hypothetical protein
MRTSLSKALSVIAASGLLFASFPKLQSNQKLWSQMLWSPEIQRVHRKLLGITTLCGPRGPGSPFYSRVPSNRCGEQGMEAFNAYMESLLSKEGVKEVLIPGVGSTRIVELNQRQRLVLWPINKSAKSEGVDLKILGKLATTHESLSGTLPYFINGSQAYSHLKRHGISPVVVASGSYTDGSTNRGSHTYGLQVDYVDGRGTIFDGPVPGIAPFGFFSIGFTWEGASRSIVSGFPAIKKVNGVGQIWMRTETGTFEKPEPLAFLFQGGPAIGASREGDAGWKPLERYKISPGLALDGLAARARIALVVKPDSNVVGFLCDKAASLEQFSDSAAELGLHGTMLDSGSKAYLKVYGKDGAEYTAIRGEAGALNANFLYTRPRF